MPITVSYQPAAAAVGGAAYVGGLGDYQRWLNQYLQNQFQFGTNVNLQEQQMAQQRQLAMANIASQMAQQQQQQAFQMQQMPMRSYLDAQNQAYQSQLATQQNAAQQTLGAQLGDQASQRDFLEQQQLAAQQANQQYDLMQAREQASTAGNMQEMQYKSQLAQGQQDMQNWQNPFAQHLQNLQKAQQAGGYTLTEEQQTEAADLKNQISKVQQAQAGGTVTMGDAMQAFKPLQQRLNAIVPSQPPPMTTEEAVSKGITWGWKDPNTGQIKAGTENTPWVVDPKTNTPQVARGWKQEDVVGQDEEGNAIYGAKFQGQIAKNQASVLKSRADYIDKRMRSLGPAFGFDMNTGMQIPGAREQAQAQFGAEFDQGVPAAHQARQTDASAITPAQEAQAQQPQAQNGQAQQNGAAQPQAIIQQISPILSKPRHEWTVQDIEAVRKARAALQAMGA